jgi:hypothetical protein
MAGGHHIGGGKQGTMHRLQSTDSRCNISPGFLVFGSHRAHSCAEADGALMPTQTVVKRRVRRGSCAESDGGHMPSQTVVILSLCSSFLRIPVSFVRLCWSPQSLSIRPAKRKSWRRIVVILGRVVFPEVLWTTLLHPVESDFRQTFLRHFCMLQRLDRSGFGVDVHRGREQIGNQISIKLSITQEYRQTNKGEM